MRRLSHSEKGTVYLAHDEDLDRQVAIKVPRLAPEEGSPAVERFVRAARVAAGLVHPNLCPIHDVGQFQGIAYLIMPYLEGTLLADRLRDHGPLPTSDAVALAHKLARAMQAAHARGILHRDLTPANVLLTSAGEPILLDFGLVRREGTSRLTTDGQILGTPAYLAPEHLSGVAGAQGPGGDIYSLGVLLYESLTGEVPFGRTLRDVLLQVLTKDARPPSMLRSGLDPALDDLCLKALARKPESRYDSMGAMADALGGYLKAQGHVEPAPSAAATGPGTGVAALDDDARQTRILPPRGAEVAGAASGDLPLQAEHLQANHPGQGEACFSGPPLPARRPRRQRWLTIAAGGVALALLTTAVFFRTEPETHGTVLVVLGDPDAEVQVELDGAAMPAADLRYPLRLTLGEHTVKVSGPVHEEARHTFLVAPGTNPDLHLSLVPRVELVPGLFAELYEGIHFNRRKQMRISEQVNWTNQQGSIDPALPADFFSARWTGFLKAPKPGKYQLVAASDDGVRLWLDGKLCLDGWSHHGRTRFVAAVELTDRPHALRLEYFQEDGLAELTLAWQPAGGAEHVVPTDALWHDRFAADRARKAPADRPPEHWRMLEGHTGTVNAVAWSPARAQVLSGGDDGSLRLWDVDTGKTVQRIASGSGALRCIAFAPDGRRALSGGADGALRLWDLEEGKEVHRLAGHAGGVARVIFLPGGKEAVSAGEDRTVRRWQVDTGKELDVFAEHTGAVQGLSVSADGRIALSSGRDNKARLWEVLGRKVQHTFDKPDDWTCAAALSPAEGQALLAEGSTIQLYDVETGKQVRPFKGHLSWCLAVAFVPGSRRAVSVGWDGTLRVWDVATGKEVRTHLGHTRQVGALAVSPDGRYAVTGGADRTVRVWELPP